VISAVITLGIYAYRRLAGDGAAPGKLTNVVSQKPPVPLGQFATAWGFTYLIVSVMAEAAPGLGGGFAILIMTADLLANAGQLLSTVAKQEASPTIAKAAAQAAAAPRGTTPLEPLQPITTPLEPLQPIQHA
jgi:hypothetical protein